MTIPNQVHFVWGLKEEPEPFHLVHYLCIESCRQIQRPERMFLHCNHRPYGRYWELVEPSLTVVPVEPTPELLGVDYDEQRVPRRYRYAHHADFVRLDALIEHGGIYADLDTLWVAPLPPELMESRFVIGREPDIRHERTGELAPSLCNALLLSEPRSLFAVMWRRTMRAAVDGTWSNHSTLLPYELSTRLPDSVRVEPPRSFYRFGPNREDLAALLEQCEPDLDGVLTLHLWAHLWWDAERLDFSPVHAGLLSEQFVRTVDTTYTVHARRFLAEP